MMIKKGETVKYVQRAPATNDEGFIETLADATVLGVHANDEKGEYYSLRVTTTAGSDAEKQTEASRIRQIADECSFKFGTRAFALLNCPITTKH